jgi:hypothetical protein
VRSAGRTAPGDALIWQLLRDSSVELLPFASDIGAPALPLIIDLLYGFDAFHELRKRFELGPWL